MNLHRMIPWTSTQTENACIQLFNIKKSQYNKSLFIDMKLVSLDKSVD